MTIGKDYQILFLPAFIDAPAVSDAWWGNGYTDFQRDNIVWDFAPIKNAFETYNGFAGSWLLARLWFLSAGKIEGSLGLNSEKAGKIDGGHFVAEAILQAETGEIVGVLGIEGSSWGYVSITLQECSESLYPETVMQAIAEWLWANPQEVSVCKITMEDFERPEVAFVYGFDGTDFYKNQDIS